MGVAHLDPILRHRELPLHRFRDLVRHQGRGVRVRLLPLGLLRLGLQPLDLRVPIERVRLLPHQLVVLRAQLGVSELLARERLLQLQLQVRAQLREPRHPPVLLRVALAHDPALPLVRRARRAPRQRLHVQRVHAPHLPLQLAAELAHHGFVGRGGVLGGDLGLDVRYGGGSNAKAHKPSARRAQRTGPRSAWSARRVARLGAGMQGRDPCRLGEGGDRGALGMRRFLF